MIMGRLYGGVCYAGIDTDPELKYPKGAGRVAFSSQQSYIAAISARFVQLQHGDIDKRVSYELRNTLCSSLKMLLLEFIMTLHQLAASRCFARVFISIELTDAACGNMKT
jgi:hypothetical protein